MIEVISRCWKSMVIQLKVYFLIDSFQKTLSTSSTVFQYGRQTVWHECIFLFTSKTAAVFHEMVISSNNCDRYTHLADLCNIFRNLNILVLH